MGLTSGLICLFAGVLLINSGVWFVKIEEWKKLQFLKKSEISKSQQSSEMSRRKKKAFFELVFASMQPASRFPSNLQFIFFFPSTHSEKREKIDVFFISLSIERESGDAVCLFSRLICAILIQPTD